MKCSEFDARQNSVGSRKFDASSEKFDASQHGLSKAINFIAIGYRKDLCMFNSYHLTIQLEKLVAAVYVCFCNLLGEDSIGIILVFPYDLL